MDKERWLEAQHEERKQHTHTIQSGLQHFGDVYRQYFYHLGINNNQLWGKRIIEIGCADFPALVFCKKYNWGLVVEPMPSPILHQLCRENIETLMLIPQCAEDFDFPAVSEVWLFNVLQHTINPDAIIEKAKAKADIIRFFEPINVPTDTCHLHTFTLEYFRDAFCDNAYVKHWPGGDHIKNFHQHECAYGVWVKSKE